MDENQKLVFQGFRDNFYRWYEEAVENLSYVEYFLMTAEEQAAYEQLRGDAFSDWFVEASNSFTYTDYVMLTYEQQQAYKATFSDAEGFNNLYNGWLANMTYEEFEALPMHQKLQYKKTYSSTAKFLVWYEAAKATAGK